MKNKKAVCFGEILWDLFPAGKKLGGAPLNVAFRMTQQGIPTSMISAIGTDSLGEELHLKAQETGVNILLQKLSTLPTGTVAIHLDTSGSATYTIVEPVAWDAIECSEEVMKTVKESDCFVYGSLVARGELSKSTLQQLLNYASFKVFDVNLRPPHFNQQELLHWMSSADLIKCNDEELDLLVSHHNFKEKSLEAQIRFLSTLTNTSLICVTLGSNGAVFYEDDTFLYQAGFTVKVQDTVGAGDSFLGTLLAGILKEEERSICLRNACAIGSLVASKTGANPILTKEEVSSLKEFKL